MEAGTTGPPRFTERGEAATVREAEPSAAPAIQFPKIADPAPLGLAGFALTTFVLSFFNADLAPASGEPIVFGLAFAYGGLAQLLAGMWEFRNGNTFGAVAFSSYGAFWLSFFAFALWFDKLLPGKDLGVAGHSVGLYLIAWGIFTAYMFIASLRTTTAVALVFILLTVTFFLLGIGQVNGDADVIHWGGYFGIATAVAAWYASFAAVTNSTFGRTIMPMGPLGKKD
jgi:succinate-acetate transporter protein